MWNVLQRKKMKREKTLRLALRGSLTVEASALLPFVILVVFVMIYLLFYVENRSFLLCSALEASLLGALEEETCEGSGTAAAYDRAKELGDAGYLGAGELSVNVSGGNGIGVSYEAETGPGIFGLSWRLFEEGTAPVLHPGRQLRQMKEGKQN